MKKPATSLIVFLFSLNCFSQNNDINLLKELNLHRNRSLDPAFCFITNSASPVSIATPFIIYTAGIIKKDKSLKNAGIYMGETILVETFISTALKQIINRDRPFKRYPFLEKASVGGSPSFPSGHTSDAFSTATSLSFVFPKWYVIVPSFVWAAAVGYSRMCLGVHYPTDVIAGAIVGSLSAFLVFKLNKWLAPKKKSSSKPG